ncbi:hypothetical protein IAR50_006584 [Cryptococcus sp. DSM 104548]
MSVDTVSHSLAHITLSNAQEPSFAPSHTLLDDNNQLVQALRQASQEVLDEYDQRNHLHSKETLSLQGRRKERGSSRSQRRGLLGAGLSSSRLWKTVSAYVPKSPENSNSDVAIATRRRRLA